ncbi:MULTISPECIES: SLC13 family permease [Roseomonadaceae]|uniref:SLC13 family permease n=1 Tax=Falsiroseomonas oleicola TaxID=2801474 RepID=A0ABS6HBE2_9PROT|nr:SLC13 family permease [Roseomonas oleicola]MBU8546003.1 SLC13 family permease [Roseomonas oleicola]
MTTAQITLLAILAATIILFIWGRWRHDVVAIAALLAAVAAGIVAPETAFAGLGHPAVVTVACILILSAALQASGAVDWLSAVAVPRKAGPTVTITALAGLAALLSAFMNNVGALALLMPVAIQVARRLELPPGRLLMPLAFGSILGGMTTLIGTPPNLIVSGFRAQSEGGQSFAMFDFAPVGVAVALSGLAFLALAWRLVPARKVSGAEGFGAGAYLTEARVPEGAKAAGMSLRAIEEALKASEAQVLGLVRHERRIAAPHLSREVHAGDILVIEAEPEALTSALADLGLKLEEDVRDDAEEKDAASESQSPAAALQSPEVVLAEFVVPPHAAIAGLSARGIRLRHQHGVNLLAISRRGVHATARLNSMALREGDMLLMQGSPETLAEFAQLFGLVPLAQRTLRLPDGRRAAMVGGVMLAAIGAAAFGLVPAAIAFAAGVLAVVLLGQMAVRRLYDAVDWPVVVLLAALIPVAEAMATTGAADVVAQTLLAPIAPFGPVAALALVLVVTMTLSDFMNNAGTAAVMCPVALGTASQLGVASDPFLMAVAIGASCAFLTPIGHQNNTLILGPGGFGFGDYWRLGLPLEVLVVLVAVPALMLFWPL